MCHVLGPLLQKGSTVKIADDLYCGGNAPQQLLENWKKLLQALHSCDLCLSASKTIINPIITLSLCNMASSDHFWQTLLLIFLIQQINICCINSFESHSLLYQSNDLNIFVGRQMENSWQLKHPHLYVAKVPRKSNSLSMVVVGSKIICLLKYSLAAIILQRSGDVTVLLNPGPINAGNLSTHSHHPNLLNLPNPTCHSCQAFILWEVDPIFCSYRDSYYHTSCVS